jgi:hypothetical protein
VRVESTDGIGEADAEGTADERADGTADWKGLPPPVALAVALGDEEAMPLHALQRMSAAAIKALTVPPLREHH